MAKFKKTDGHQARKRFGQNFLQDQSIIAEIVNAVHPTGEYRLVEIGPGLGALTEPVLRQARKLDVVELDRDLIPKLKQMAEGKGELTIHEADALKFDFGALAEEGPISVFGNLPYNISTPLIFHLCSFAEKIAEMHFMLQKEVVDRLAAEPGSKRYGKLSVMVQYHCEVESLFVVPPHAFIPAPKVDSAIVRLVPHETKPFEVNNEADLNRLVSAAFNQRRKTLRNALKDMLTEEQIQSAGVNPADRAENISLAEFVALTDLLSND